MYKPAYLVPYNKWERCCIWSKVYFLLTLQSIYDENLWQIGDFNWTFQFKAKLWFDVNATACKLVTFGSNRRVCGKELVLHITIVKLCRLSGQRALFHCRWFEFEYLSCPNNLTRKWIQKRSHRGRPIIRSFFINCVSGIRTYVQYQFNIGSSTRPLCRHRGIVFWLNLLLKS